MSSWTSGYVADLGYTYGFYRELTPALLGLVALARGQTGPDASAPLHYCELGCGQGLSMNLLASANPHIKFHATDFNPSQIAGARALTAEAGLDNVTFYDTSFSHFVDEPGLPEKFDIIALHGIYSWINADLRASIVDFISRKLRVGGLVYISYNCLPGWSSAAPMRHLMYLHGKVQGGPTGGRLQSALDFVDTMQKSGAAYFRAIPGLDQRLEKLKDQNHNYLAHEYFNDAWDLFYHSDVVKDLDAAKLSFLGSAALLEQVDAINLSADQQQIMGGIADPVLRETVRDYMTNQQFRRDVFVKGPVALTPRLAQEAWLNQRFALSTRRDDIALTVRGALGEATLQEDVYRPVLDKLADGPMTVRHMVTDTAIADLGWARLQQALVVLVGAGHLQPCLPAKDDAKRAKNTRAFNQAVLQRARDNADLQYLASPVTGGGLAVPRFHQLFLLALSEGRKQSEEWAALAWQVLSAQGQRIVKEGKTLDTPEENLAELEAQAAAFAQKQLSVLKGLQVI
ncbi:class I SAM-dependent methyltransferase [Devosia sp. SD17-2]|uniref:class I SAM-dependent methyltransferase n=1 Tax=Devosia sp. SD17-2 TaxID=2976459 RepID=UPI0023D89A24|nr:class I SAM-dependent methyltransferase [Devosia sp. SD17-2]WEJ32924.1 methyltransferase regulatory domain-containing protein [Devosia sp. SD17-2]